MRQLWIFSVITAPRPTDEATNGEYAPDLYIFCGEIATTKGPRSRPYLEPKSLAAEIRFRTVRGEKNGADVGGVHARPPRLSLACRGDENACEFGAGGTSR